MHWPALLSLGSGILNQAALLATGIIAARALGPDGRGAQALLTLLPFVLSQVGTLGLPSAVVYFLGTSQVSSRGLAPALRRAAVTQTLATSAVLAAVLLLVGQWYDAADWRVAVITLLVLPVMIAFEYQLAVLQGQHRLIAFQLLRPAPNLLYMLALGVLVVSSAAVDLVDVLACWFLAQAVLAASTAVVVRRGLSGAAADGDPGLVRRMRSFGRRSLLGVVSPVEHLRVDQLLAGFLLGPAALGLYVSASAFTGLTRTLSQSVGVIAYPDVARRSRTGAGSGALRRGLGYVALAAVGVTAIAVVVVLAAPWLVRVTFGPEFSGAAPAARILIVAGALLALRRVIGDVARGTGRAAVNSWAEGATLAALLLAFAAVGGRGTPEAAAWAVLVAAGCGLVVLAGQLVRPRMRSAA